MNSVLVVRSYGGFGDLAMMSRAVRKLQQTGCDVGFMVEGKWQRLFDDWKDLKIYDTIVGVWDQIIDIGVPCPASEVESRWVLETREASGRSTVPVDRISIFANRIGIQLSQEEKIPYIACSNDRKIGVDKPAVYIQMKTAESYRNWPFMEKIAKGFVSQGINVWTQGADEHIKGTKEFKGSILDAVALIRECVLVVSPDSFAVHAAAAVGTPCVAIMGPIGADTRIKFYPYASSVALDVPCLPCWRNENNLCHKNNTFKSWCMTHLHEGAVYQHVLARLHESMKGQLAPSVKYAVVKPNQPHL
jgi:hypothetical protein